MMVASARDRPTAIPDCRIQQLIEASSRPMPRIRTTVIPPVDVQIDSSNFGAVGARNKDNHKMAAIVPAAQLNGSILEVSWFLRNPTSGSPEAPDLFLLAVRSQRVLYWN